MNKTQKLTSYEQRQADRIVSMWSNLVMGGLKHDEAIERIIRDLKRSGSSIGPNFVRMVLNQ